MNSPHSYYDALETISSLGATLDSVATAEVHLFCYLSCLLSVFRGQPVGEWGYKFAVTEQGYPYSAQIDEALKTLEGNGSLICEQGSYYRLSDFGSERLSQLRQFPTLGWRDEYLKGASDSTLTMPVGIIRRALAQEIGVKSAVEISRSKLLPSNMAIDLLHEQFAALNKAVGIDIDDLMIPAVVWLTYLSEQMSESSAA